MPSILGGLWTTSGRAGAGDSHRSCASTLDFTSDHSEGTGRCAGRGDGRPIPYAVELVNGLEVGRGSFSVDVPINQEIVLRVEAPGYQFVELIIRPHLDPNRPRTLTAPIRLKPIPSGRTPE